MSTKFYGFEDRVYVPNNAEIRQLMLGNTVISKNFLRIRKIYHGDA